MNFWAAIHPPLSIVRDTAPRPSRLSAVEGLEMMRFRGARSPRLSLKERVIAAGGERERQEDSLLDPEAGEEAEEGAEEMRHPFDYGFLK